MIDRRTLITGLAAMLAAPAVVRAESLMPIRAQEEDLYSSFNVAIGHNALLRPSVFMGGLGTHGYFIPNDSFTFIGGFCVPNMAIDETTLVGRAATGWN